MDKTLAKFLENAPLALIVIGLVLLVTAAAGGWPQLKLQIDDWHWRVALAAIGVVVAAGGGFLEWRDRAEKGPINPKKYDFKITNLKDGSKVQTPDIFGSYSKEPPPGYVLMIFDFGPNQHTYRPRQKAILEPSTRTWAAFHVTVHGDPGEERFLILALVGKAGQALCTYFDEVTEKVGPERRPPIYALTPDIVECHRIRVIKG